MRIAAPSGITRLYHVTRARFRGPHGLKMPARLANPVAAIVDLLDALHCGAMLIDRSGRIVHANDRLCEMTARRRGELDGHDLRGLYPSGDGRAQVERLLQHFDEARENEFFLPLADGGRIPVIVSGRQLAGPPPLPDHRLITVIDISRQKQAEAHCKDQYREVAKLSDTVLEQALALKHYSRTLEGRVRERTAELHDANMEAIYMLAVASEAKDADTGAHVLRMQRYAEALATELGLEQAEQIGYSAILHDVGKMQVPDQILKKPGPLTPAERGQMQLHTVAGERILSKKPFFDLARQIARSHHENWDGSGYPDGLAGERIPPPARIVHLADVFDGLTSQRVYKPAWPAERAAELILESGGHMFDPELVRAFASLRAAGALGSLRAPQGGAVKR